MGKVIRRSITPHPKQSHHLNPPLSQHRTTPRSFPEFLLFIYHRKYPDSHTLTTPNRIFPYRATGRSLYAKYTGTSCYDFRHFISIALEGYFKKRV